MKTLNLVYPDKSEIAFTISKFPDGQQNITIDTSNINLREEVTIKSRLNNWLDLELVCCTTAALRASGVKDIALFTPYILGARSDRKFELGSNQYLSKVLAPVLNTLGFNNVYVVDPHSYVLENVIERCVPRTNAQFVQWALGAIGSKDYVLVAPDAGASHKIHKVANIVAYDDSVLICSKERDEKGQLTKVEIPMPKGNYGVWAKKDFIIVDDICDGGATFINIAKELKKLFPKQSIYLVVTHGIFSKGFDELHKYFDGIYCTNSYKDLANGPKAQFNTF